MPWIVRVVASGTSIVFYTTELNCYCSGSTYQWHRTRSGVTAHVGTNSSSYTATSPATGDEYWCEFTSNCQCVSGNPADSKHIFVVVQALPPKTVTIVANPAGAVCAGTSVTFTAYPQGFTTPTYKWYVDGVFQTGQTAYQYPTSSLINGEVVKCGVKENGAGTEYFSNNIVMVIIEQLIPYVTIQCTPSNSVCAGVEVTFAIDAISGQGASPSYQWYKNGSVQAGQVGTTFKFIPSNGDYVKLRMTPSETCKSPSYDDSNTITMTVTANVTPGCSIEADQSCLPASGNVVFTASGTNTGTTPVYQWYYKVSSGAWQTGYTGRIWTTSSFSGLPYVIVCCVMIPNLTCVQPPAGWSSALTLNACECSYGSNIVTNGGGSGTTDWLPQSNPPGLGTGWLKRPEINSLIGYDDVNFSGYYQRIDAANVTNQNHWLASPDFGITNALGKKYKLTFKYKCWTTSYALRVYQVTDRTFINAGSEWGSGTISLWIGGNTYGSSVSVEVIFTATNNQFRGIIFSFNPQPLNAYSFYEVDIINVFPCV